MGWGLVVGSLPHDFKGRVDTVLTSAWGSSGQKLQFLEREFSALVLGGTISTASIESLPECRNLHEIYGAKKTEKKGYK